MAWIAEQMAENGMVTQAREVLAMERELAEAKDGMVRMTMLHKGLMANADQRYEELSAALSDAKAEMAKAMDQCQRYALCMNTAGIDDLWSRAERAEAENARLRKDAQRYRWLRDRPLDILFHLFKIEGGRNPDDELDAAIDAALSASPNESTKGGA